MDSSTNQKKITPKKENKTKKTLAIRFTAAPLEHCVTQQQQQQQQQQSFIVLMIQKCKDIKRK